MSKNWMGKNLILLSWGLLLLALSSMWLNIFGELLKGSVDLPVPTATTELVDVDLKTVAHEKSVLINKIAAYPDYDTNVRVPYATLSNITDEHVPVIIRKSYAPPLFASEFLLSIPELFSSLENHGIKLKDNVTGATSAQSVLYQGLDYERTLDPLNAQFNVPSNYASFFSVTLMQDRLPPAMTQNSVSAPKVIRKAYSPKPKLRPQSLNNGILIAVGYFTIKQNLERTLQTLELTGYPFSQKKLKEEGSLVTVGPFPSKTSAQKALEITKVVGFSDAYILN
ncbi:MAG: SPOR domain-containing protein [Paracoccaceae bacterium]